MDDKSEAPQAPKVEKVGKIDLAAAVRRARLENAERAAAIADLREIEAGRLALLESALKPLVRHAPAGVDMFDLTLSRGERPRLFLDMVAFIEMGRDRRTYRMFQDTLHGRVLIAEGQQIDRIVAAVTNYVARRLVERERALASESAPGEAGEPLAMSVRQDASPETASPDEAQRLAAAIAPPPLRSRLVRRLGAALRFVVMTLGSVTLIGLFAIAGYVVWTIWLQDMVARWMGVSRL
ncbi:MAG: hypothetical protein JO288_21200 [Hyphomicrobiales bacterium]|nr:hypothetical protein [Hyphomicrobiales bacterium]